MINRALFALVIVVAVSSVAVAGGTWSDKVNHRYSNGTSVKVIEPEGFKVVVTTAEGDKVGTVPDVFAMPDQDAFVKVTITAPDGTVWTKKVEVKAKNQTELTVSFKADDAKPAAPAKAGRAFIGQVINRSGGCGTKWEGTIRAEFLNADGAVVVKSAQIDSQKNADVEVPAGKYDVRVFRYTGTEWIFSQTTPQTVPANDGWRLGWGCPKGQRSPTLVVQ